MNPIKIFKENNERILSIIRYFAASLIPLILNLATNPLVASNMSAEDYAIVGYFKSYNTLILPLVLFYVLHYYTKRFYELDDKRRIELKAYIFKFLIYASAIIALISIGGIYVYTFFLNSNSQIPLFPYVWIAILALPLTGLYSLTLVDYKMARMSKSYLWISVMYSIVTVGLLLLFVVVFKMGAFGNLISILITNAIFFGICCYMNRELFKVKVRMASYKPIVLFCLPLTLAAALGFFSNGYDRVYLERLGQVEELGYYVVAFSICNYLHYFSDAVGNTFQPDIFQSLANRNLIRYIKFSGIILAANALVVLIFIPLSTPIVDILTAGKYVYSSHYMKILSVSSFASAIYYVVSQFTVAMGLTSITLYNKIFTSVASVIIYKVAIDNYGFDGAAWGVSLSFLVSAIGNILFMAIYKNKLKQIWQNPQK